MVFKFHELEFFEKIDFKFTGKVFDGTRIPWKTQVFKFEYSKSDKSLRIFETMIN